MYKKLHYRSLITLLLPLCALLSSIGCQESSEPSITKINEALEPIDVPIQTAQFQLVEEESGRVLADGFSLEAIAQAASPIVNGEVVFGSSDTGIPEGYIVQVNNYEEGRLLKEHNVSSTNRLLFL